MATYYKYVERNAKDRINWNEVGKSVSDMLNEEAKVRLDKKAEIDENSRQFGIELANSPVGDYDHGNNFINEYTTNMSEYRRMQDNLLKTGQLNLGEYTRNRQNNTDGTKLTFDLATAYQEAYTEKMDRWEKGESDYREVWEMEQVEGLANLRNTGSFINPTNGVISLATRTEDGGLDINNTLTAAEMYGSIKRSYNKYDVNKAVAEEVGFLGEVIEADLVKALRAGDVNTIQEIADKKLSPAYNQWEDDTVSSMMVNKNHISSALTTYKLQTDKGEFYTFTYNEDEFKNDKSGRLIYLDRNVDANGVPVFKPEQEGIVEDFFRNRIRSQIGSKESIQSAGSKQYAPVANVKIADETKSANELLDEKVSMIGYLYYGNDAQIKAATEYFRDQNEDIQSVKRTDEGIFYTYKKDDGSLETRDIKFYVGGNLKSQEEFIKSAGPILTGEDNIDKALERGSYNKDGVFNTSDTEFLSDILPQTDLDYTEEINSFIDDTLNEIKVDGKAPSSSDIKNKAITLKTQTQGQVKEQLEERFKDYGLVVDLVGGAPAGNKIRIRVPSKDLVFNPISTFNYTSSGAVEEMDKLRAQIKAFLDIDKEAEENNWVGSERDENGL